MAKHISKPSSLRQQAPTSAKLSKCSAFIGLSAGLLGASPLMYAQDLPNTTELDEVTVTAGSKNSPYVNSEATYKAEISGDLRRTETLAETPQTIDVLTEDAIKDSGKTDLKEILRAQPGITLGTGENGNAFGDRYIIRGHEARSDIFVDGLKDPGMTTRESFATEQIEITKGPSATFAGRGSTGGAVNSVTKQASTQQSFNELEVGGGSDNYFRATLDNNIVLTDDTAARINLLHATEDIPDRAPAERERNGIAASIQHNVTDRFSVLADYYYLNAEDKPDLGTYIQSGGQPVDDIPVYVQDEDFQNSEVNVGTIHMDYIFNNDLILSNATRYGQTNNGYFVTGARGGEAIFTNSDNSTTTVTVPSLSSHQGWQEVDYFVNQSNLFLNADIFNTEHAFVFGFEYSDIGVTNGTYDYSATGTSNCQTNGRNGLQAGYCIIDANGNEVSNINSLMQREISKGSVDADYSIKTYSLYSADTINLTPSWVLAGGFRVDRFDYQNIVTGHDNTVTDYSYDDTLFNGFTSLMYKFDENANIYINYGTASNINGGESDVGANCGYGGLCADSTTSDSLADIEPEQTENIEVGTKCNLNNGKLLFTTAVFQITKDDVFEGAPRGSSYDSVGTINTGKNRVKGIEFGLVGNITDKLSTQLGLAMMQSEILKSSNTDSIGKPLANFAEDSAYAQLRYQFIPQFALGAIATYSSETYSGQPDSASSDNYTVPAYVVYDVFAEYQYNKQLSARLNIENITDKDYYLATYRSGAFTYIGDARNAKLTLAYNF